VSLGRYASTIGFVADNLDDWRMTWNSPITVRLGSAHFHPGDRLDIAVGIAFEPQVGHALARLSVGPTNALAQRLAIRGIFAVRHARGV